MSDHPKRFDDTVWGTLFRFWPIVLLLLSMGGILLKKLNDHDVRLATLEQSSHYLASDISEMKGDIKELLRR